MKKNFAIISPALPPTIDGLGDYSVQLGQKIRQNFDNVFYFSPENKFSIDNFFYFNTSSKRLLKSIQTLNVTHVLINYSGYGYNKRGLPFWIPKIIRKMRERGIIVGVFFHEIYASSLFFSIRLLVFKLQKRLFQQIYKESNFSFCSNSIVKNLIQKQTLDKGSKSHLIGIFSNIPEPFEISNFDTRKSTVIVFGTKGRRKLVYQNYQKWLPVLISLSITSIIDIGEPLDTSYPILPIQIYSMGILEKLEIAQYFQNASFGLISYPSQLLGKSGIFASYAAFGIIPICLNESNDDDIIDGIYSNVHFIDVAKWKFDVKIDISQVSKNIYNWYMNNRSIDIHSNTLVKVFKSNQC